MNLMANISNAFWNEKFWLPANYSWKDIEPGSHGINHANYKDLIWPIPMSIIFMSLRFLAEKFCFVPLGKSLGIRSTKSSPPQANHILESAYKKKSKLNREMVLRLSKQFDLNDREIERWWRKRRGQDKPTILVKFCEHCWRFLAYSVNFSIGLSALWDKPYLWNILHCAYGYPYHGVDDGVWWYYMISNSFYWSLTFSQFFDVKRKDFYEMALHHVLCLFLFAFSWVCNVHRVGAVILLVHDSADVLLDAAKSLNYAKMKKSCDVVFGLFTIVWIVTRLIIFPRIIYSCIFETQQPFYPAHALFVTLLVGLLILHFIWTHMILKVALRSLKSGEFEDVRSSSEDSVTEDENENEVKRVEVNCEISDSLPAYESLLDYRLEKSKKNMIR